MFLQPSRLLTVLSIMSSRSAPTWPLAWTCAAASRPTELPPRTPSALPWPVHSFLNSEYTQSPPTGSKFLTQSWGHTNPKKLPLAYLKFKCNWPSCILSATLGREFRLSTWPLWLLPPCPVEQLGLAPPGSAYQETPEYGWASSNQPPNPSHDLSKSELPPETCLLT